MQSIIKVPTLKPQMLSIGEYFKYYTYMYITLDLATALDLYTILLYLELEQNVRFGVRSVATLVRVRGFVCPELSLYLPLLATLYFALSIGQAVRGPQSAIALQS